MDKLLLALSEQVIKARDLESLTRPLLEMLESVTGLESTYLTELTSGKAASMFCLPAMRPGCRSPRG